MLIVGLGYIACQSVEDTPSYGEAEEMAWNYLEKSGIAGVVTPVLPTGSMGVELHQNHLAVVELVPFDKVEVGQVAVFRERGLPNATAHTVEHILEDGRLKTRGRTNEHFDPLVTEEMFIGVVTQTFAFRGNPVAGRRFS